MCTCEQSACVGISCAIASNALAMVRHSFQLTILADSSSSLDRECSCGDSTTIALSVISKVSIVTWKDMDILKYMRLSSVYWAVSCSKGYSREHLLFLSVGWILLAI